MMSLKPIFLWKYLGFKRNKLPKNIGRLFYLSWEDALWDILEKKQIKKGSTVLVPEFFCGDVENNIKNHGYKIAYYSVSNKLQTTNKQLTESIKKYNPKVLIIFHAIGITNNLFDKTDWLKKMNKDSILIEDSVHKIVNSEKIKFLKDNHFVIDSLRKVVPLQGSVVYAQKNDINFSEPNMFQSWQYATSVTLLWALMNYFWGLAQILKGKKLSIWLADKANKTMKAGYDLIGNNLLPARGFFIFNFLQQFISIEKIKQIKRKQVDFYEKKLTDLSENMFQKVPYNNSDKTELIAYPLVLPINIANQILKKILEQGLMLDFELNDSMWSKKQKIIYLPLGPHITKYDLNKIVNIFNIFNT